MRRRSVATIRGFTLIEALAMLAIGSALIVATTSLVHDVAGSFDRGTRGASEGERIMLAIERLAQDFGSARFVLRDDADGPAVAFTADPASADAPAKIVFVSSATVMTGPQGDDVVTLTIEPKDDGMRLVRRRAEWKGSHMHFADAAPRDPVVLIEGNLDIAFLFAGVTPDGAMQWSKNWVDRTSMPRFVRLMLREPATGRDLLGEADFVVRADAPATCGRPAAKPNCLGMALNDVVQTTLVGGVAQTQAGGAPQTPASTPR
jgi:general secretion pathway protein J